MRGPDEEDAVRPRRGRWCVLRVAPDEEGGLAARPSPRHVIGGLQELDGLDARVAQVVERDHGHAAGVGEPDQLAKVVHGSRGGLQPIAIDRVEAFEASASLRRREDLDRRNALSHQIVESDFETRRVLDRKRALASRRDAHHRGHRFPPAIGNTLAAGVLDLERRRSGGWAGQDEPHESGRQDHRILTGRGPSRPPGGWACWAALLRARRRARPRPRPIGPPQRAIALRRAPPPERR